MIHEGVLAGVLARFDTGALPQMTIDLWSHESDRVEPPNGHDLDPPMRWCLGDDPCVCVQVYLAQLEVVNAVRKVIENA